MGFPTLIGQKWFTTETFLDLLSIALPVFRTLNIIPAAAFAINVVVLGIELRGYQGFVSTRVQGQAE